MPRPTASATALATLLMLGATPLAAQSASGMQFNDAEREAFRAEVRAYLMENPEVIFEAVAEFERRTAEAQAEMDTTLVEINAEEIFNDGHSWVGGNPDGDLTLVEFMDYRCSFCARAYPAMMDFVNGDGNVRLVIKEFPILGPQSDAMSRFAIAVQHNASDEIYFEAHDRLINWDGDFTETSARLLASELGLDADRIIGYMPSGEVDAILRANRELAQRLQISGTPTFVIGDGGAGELLRGFLPSEGLHAAADRLRG